MGPMPLTLQSITGYQIIHRKIHTLSRRRNQILLRHPLPEISLDMSEQLSYKVLKAVANTRSRRFCYLIPRANILY